MAGPAMKGKEVHQGIVGTIDGIDGTTMSTNMCLPIDPAIQFASFWAPGIWGQYFFAWVCCNVFVS